MPAPDPFDSIVLTITFENRPNLILFQEKYVSSKLYYNLFGLYFDNLANEWVMLNNGRDKTITGYIDSFTSTKTSIEATLKVRNDVAYKLIYF